MTNRTFKIMIGILVVLIMVRIFGLGYDFGQYDKSEEANKRIESFQNTYKLLKDTNNQLAFDNGQFYMMLYSDGKRPPTDYKEFQKWLETNLKQKRK